MGDSDVGTPAGLSTEQFSVSTYVGSSKNLKDLKIDGVQDRVCVGWPFDGGRWAIEVGGGLL